MEKHQKLENRMQKILYTRRLIDVQFVQGQGPWG